MQKNLFFEKYVLYLQRKINDRMNVKSLILLFIVVIFSFCSCQNSRKRSEIEKVLSEWTGKEILFHEGVPCYVAGALATIPWWQARIDKVNSTARENFFK